MPWIKTEDNLPQLNKELYLFKDGKRWKGKVEQFDLYDGRGGMNKAKMPDFWGHISDNCESWPDPDGEIKGISTDVKTQEDVVRPKIDPAGIQPKQIFSAMGNDGYAGL